MADETLKRILATLQRMEARQQVVEARLKGIEDIQELILRDLEESGIVSSPWGATKTRTPPDLQKFLPAPDGGGD